VSSFGRCCQRHFENSARISGALNAFVAGTFVDLIPSVRFITAHVLQLLFVVLADDGLELSVTDSSTIVCLQLTKLTIH
jgi:hypothetical protein